jgi:hypothetical protein
MPISLWFLRRIPSKQLDLCGGLAFAEPNAAASERCLGREEDSMYLTEKHYFIKRLSDGRYVVRAKESGRAFFNTQQEAIDYVEELSFGYHQSIWGESASGRNRGEPWA